MTVIVQCNDNYVIEKLDFIVMSQKENKCIIYCGYCYSWRP